MSSKLCVPLGRDDYQFYDEAQDGYSQKGMRTGTVVDTIIVPDFIDRALGINNSNTIDLLSYSLVRKVASIRDVAVWSRICMDCTLSHAGQGIPLSDELPFFFDRHEKTQAAKVEIANTLVPTAYEDPMVKSSSLEFLNFQDEDTTQSLEPSDYYQFKSIGETVLIIVKPGFLIHLEQPGAKLAYTRSWIKELEKILPPERIAAFGLFSLYLNCLRKDI